MSELWEHKLGKTKRQIKDLTWLLSTKTTVIKPGPDQHVDPGSGSWTGSGLLKDRQVQRPGKTRSTRHDPGDPGEPGQDPMF